MLTCVICIARITRAGLRSLAEIRVAKGDLSNCALLTLEMHSNDLTWSSDVQNTRFGASGSELLLAMAAHALAEGGFEPPHHCFDGTEAPSTRFTL